MNLIRWHCYSHKHIVFNPVYYEKLNFYYLHISLALSTVKIIQYIFVKNLFTVVKMLSASRLIKGKT